MMVRVYLLNGQICHFPGVDRVLMHQPGDTIPPEPGLLALSAANVLGWVADDVPPMQLQIREQEGANNADQRPA